MYSFLTNRIIPTKKKKPKIFLMKNQEQLTSEDCIKDPSLMQRWHSILRDDRGVMRSTSLFFESKRELDPHLIPIFTLKAQDHLVRGVLYISLQKLYFSYDHIPGFEYQFAKDVFGSWDIWAKLTRSSLRHEFQSWRDELDIKIKANAIKQMMQASRTDDAKGVAAAKYLADKGYIEGTTRKRGRPSNDDIARERKAQLEVQNTLTADMERLGLKVVN